ncbi:hypothetical protein BP5796_04014 [Coleophoma crateriformis]|uniref:Uncharacterized protein n=1 Tax=Coleophoma crateriformis TaxID=565419 RepID=A0A3D8SH62_9HELO|nr:hypothetical protein BP5796_04014 [Coleophoma crateriformis]
MQLDEIWMNQSLAFSSPSPGPRSHVAPESENWSIFGPNPWISSNPRSRASAVMLGEGAPKFRSTDAPSQDISPAPTGELGNDSRDSDSQLQLAARSVVSLHSVCSFQSGLW